MRDVGEILAHNSAIFLSQQNISYIATPARQCRDLLQIVLTSVISQELSGLFSWYGGTRIPNPIHSLLGQVKILARVDTRWCQLREGL